MQNVIRNGAKAREPRLPGDDPSRGIGSFSRSAGRKAASTGGLMIHRFAESDLVRLSIELIGTISSGLPQQVIVVNSARERMTKTLPPDLKRNKLCPHTKDILAKGASYPSAL